MHQQPASSLHKFVVLAASCFISFTHFGVFRLGGLLYVASIEKFNIGRKEAALPFTLCFTVKTITGPIFGYLGNRFGLELVTLLGCFLSAISVGACFLVDDIIPFTVLWAGCYGFACGMGTTLIPNILHMHFDKSFNTMHGLFQAFGCMGAMVSPSVCEFLLTFYGMSGTLLVLSGCILNCVPAAMLLRKPPKILNHSVVVENTIKEEANVETDISALNIKCNDLTISELSKCSPEVNPTHSDLEIVNPLKSPNDLCAADDNKINIYCLNSKYQQVSSLYSYTQTEGCEITTYETKSPITTTNGPPQKDKVNPNRVSSLSDLPKTTFQNISLSDLPKTTFQSIEDRDLRTKNKFHKKFNVFSRNFKVFLDPTYMIFLTSLGIWGVVALALKTVIVDVCRDKGFTQDVAVLTTLAVADMLGRFFLGYVADVSCFSQVSFFVVCVLCYGVLLMSLVWIMSFYMVLLAIAASGFLSGGIVVVAVGIIKEWIEKENITMAFSSKLIVFALLSFALPPTIGYFRGGLGSYDGLFYLMGSLCVLGGLIAAFIPAAARHRDKEKKRRSFVKDIIAQNTTI